MGTAVEVELRRTRRIPSENGSSLARSTTRLALAVWVETPQPGTAATVATPGSGTSSESVAHEGQRLPRLVSAASVCTAARTAGYLVNQGDLRTQDLLTIRRVVAAAELSAAHLVPFLAARRIRPSGRHPNRVAVDHPDNAEGSQQAVVGVASPPGLQRDRARTAC